MLFDLDSALKILEKTKKCKKAQEFFKQTKKRLERPNNSLKNPKRTEKKPRTLKKNSRNEWTMNHFFLPSTNAKSTSNAHFAHTSGWGAYFVLKFYLNYKVKNFFQANTEKLFLYFVWKIGVVLKLLHGSVHVLHFLPPTSLIRLHFNYWNSIKNLCFFGKLKFMHRKPI